MSKMLDFVPGSNGSDNALFIDFLASEIIPLIYENRIWLKYLYSTAADPNWELFLKKHIRLGSAKTFNCLVKWVYLKSLLKNYLLIILYQL